MLTIWKRLLDFQRPNDFWKLFKTFEFFSVWMSIGIGKNYCRPFLETIQWNINKNSEHPPPPPFYVLYRIANIFYNAQQSVYFLTYDTLKIKAFSSQKSIVTSYIAATMIFSKIDSVIINIFASTMRYITLIVFQLFVIELTSLFALSPFLLRRVLKMQTTLFLRLSNTVVYFLKTSDLILKETVLYTLNGDIH